MAWRTPADLLPTAGPWLATLGACAASIEHDGLGRYGDPIHPLGDVAALGEFAMLLRPGGLLVFAERAFDERWEAYRQPQP